MALSYVAQSARGIYQPAVPQREIDEGRTVTSAFMTRWQGEPDPEHVGRSTPTGCPPPSTA